MSVWDQVHHENVDDAYWGHSYCVLDVKSVIAIILEEEAWKLESVELILLG